METVERHPYSKLVAKAAEDEVDLICDVDPRLTGTKKATLGARRLPALSIRPTADYGGSVAALPSPRTEQIRTP